MSPLRRTNSALVLACVLTWSTATAFAQSEQDTEATSEPAEDSSSDSASPRITFEVPLRGAPKMRVGGGVRGVDAMDLTLSVLTPEEAGLTTKSAPTVYWYASDRVETPVEIAFTDTTSLEAAAVPLVDVTLSPPVDRGIHGFSLADHGVELRPDVEYQWFVAAIRDPEQRSKDIIAGGAIIYRPATANLIRQLTVAQANSQTAIFLAESGIWYDAVDELSRSIASNAGDGGARSLRAELLEQVGLVEAASYDRGGG